MTSLSRIACASGLLLPSPVLAHAFAQRYTLPVPFSLYAWGATIALALSFIVVGVFATSQTAFGNGPTSPGSTANGDRAGIPNVGRLVSLSLLALCIAAGLFGTQNVYDNFSMTFFWIIFVLGVPYLTALIGDFYASVNPWRTLVEWIERGSAMSFSGRFVFPKWLGYYPAFVLYATFIWLELFGHLRPRGLAVALLAYTGINLVGAWAWGKQTWFRQGEFFAVSLRIIGLMSPRARSSGERAPTSTERRWRFPLAGLLEERVDHLSLALFILFMLASTAFDGLHSTQPWAVMFWREIFPHLAEHFPRSPKGSAQAYAAWQWFTLWLSPLVYLAVFSLFVIATKGMAESQFDTRQLLLRFSLTLVPIAFVYHFTHYYTMLLSQGPQIVHLVSDPFGFGWNLFGTADLLRVPIMVDMNTVWHTQVALIVIGHVASVYLAHVEALRAFATRRDAIVSQLPMLCLMMAFTAFGLWILSQPLSSGR